MSNPINTSTWINWDALPNEPIIPAERGTAAAPTAAVPAAVPAAVIDPRWAPRPRTAQFQEATRNLHAEPIAAGPRAPPGWVPPRPKPAVLNPNSFPKGALTLKNKSKQIAQYEQKLRNLEALQQVKKNKKLPNVNSVIASFLTGEEKKSVNQQIKELKNVIEKLKSPARGGTRRKHHLKRRFKSSKRKTT